MPTIGFLTIYCIHYILIGGKIGGSQAWWCPPTRSLPLGWNTFVYRRNSKSISRWRIIGHRICPSQPWESTALLRTSNNGDNAATETDESILSSSTEQSSRKPTFTIRQCEYSELSQVADIMMDSFYTESGIWKRLYQLAELNRLQQNFAYPDTVDQHQMLVVELAQDDDDDKDNNTPIIVGFCDIDARPLPVDFATQLPRPYLSDLCISPNYRRQGLAKALVQEAERFCIHTLDSKVLWIRVQEANPVAMAMYQQLGYTVTSKDVDAASKKAFENKEIIFTLRKDLLG
ncbi:acyl-CoA N-acyltransferase [Nitzschia inconspicua]|uniref:Acyl-CoA N-acyltransferase n=1 Tax=Nitzschia inconspicua TaxID=303405 RepID=A0A9K3PIM6_9STRA|nr:acyl-CoA N-acyltransferase [Nitzschia inconspicua]